MHRKRSGASTASSETDKANHPTCALFIAHPARAIYATSMISIFRYLKNNGTCKMQCRESSRLKRNLLIHDIPDEYSMPSSLLLIPTFFIDGCIFHLIIDALMKISRPS
jgi:hypothetical protein